MFVPWALVTVASLLLLVYTFQKREENSEKKRKKGKYAVIFSAVFDFFFRVKSEDRLNCFKAIHKVFPRFLRVSLFNSDNIIIYDPDLCKKVYSAQVACQRPFRNCFQLENGLLSSECTKTSSHFTVNCQIYGFFALAQQID